MNQITASLKLICPRCSCDQVALMASSPVKGVWEVYICNRCFYSWRTTEPEGNTDPNKYPANFRLTVEDIEQLPILPTIPPLRRS